jgi:ankyrin repeat protein
MVVAAQLIYAASMAEVVSESALLEAVRAGDAERVRTLLDAGADPNASDGGKNALHWNAMWGKRDRLGVLSQLVEHGAELDTPDSDGVPALVWAVAGKHADLIVALIDAGADPNGKGAFPPLFQAAYQGKAEFAELLLAKGADPALTHEGKDAASWAEKGKHLDLAKRLRAASQ